MTFDEKDDHERLAAQSAHRLDDIADFWPHSLGHSHDLRCRHSPVGRRASAFIQNRLPGLLPPLGILFALFVAFTATQVWNDNEKANSVVDREASALRTVVILAAAFPGETETHLRNLVRSYIADAVAQDWPMMAHRTATLQIIPYSLAEALQFTLTPDAEQSRSADCTARDHYVG